MPKIDTSDLSKQMQRVMEFFEEISTIPRGSGNMQKISDYCENFAIKQGLKYHRDQNDNVIIFKDASKGYETHQSIILQGHLDIVCQKEDYCEIDFLKDGLEIYRDGNFLTAHGTTLGADNGIALSYIFAILESESIAHPPIEAIFTTDEEIGLLGAAALDKSILKAKRMINIDSEEDDTLTVSCAGGQRVTLCFEAKRQTVKGFETNISIKGLLGGHSGVEIDKGRINANILAGRLLNHLSKTENFDIVSMGGGDKDNAIPKQCEIALCVLEPQSFQKEFSEFISIIKKELAAREPSLNIEIQIGSFRELSCLDKDTKQKLISLLSICPNGIMQMSAEIDGLVETSLNLGILEAKDNHITSTFSLRSNKLSALEFLTERLENLGALLGAKTEVSAFYPPWEYRKDSLLREIYKDCYYKKFKKEIKVCAIHAGLECAIFSSQIDALDCISIGPTMFDVHTTNERLDIISADNIYSLILKVLEKL